MVYFDIFTDVIAVVLHTLEHLRIDLPCHISTIRNILLWLCCIESHTRIEYYYQSIFKFTAWIFDIRSLLKKQHFVSFNNMIPIHQKKKMKHNFLDDAFPTGLCFRIYFIELKINFIVFLFVTKTKKNLQTNNDAEFINSEASFRVNWPGMQINWNGIGM